MQRNMLKMRKARIVRKVMVPEMAIAILVLVDHSVMGFLGLGVSVDKEGS